MVTTRGQEQLLEQLRNAPRPPLPTRDEFFRALPYLSTLDLPNNEFSQCRLCKVSYLTSSKRSSHSPEPPTRTACGHYFGRACLIARHQQPNYGRHLLRERYICTCAVPACRTQLFSQHGEDDGESVAIKREEDSDFEMMAIPELPGAAVTGAPSAVMAVPATPTSNTAPGTVDDVEMGETQAVSARDDTETSEPPHTAGHDVPEPEPDSDAERERNGLGELTRAACEERTDVIRGRRPSPSHA
jgi:hypothetical protein